MYLDNFYKPIKFQGHWSKANVAWGQYLELSESFTCLLLHLNYVSTFYTSIQIHCRFYTDLSTFIKNPKKTAEVYNIRNVLLIKRKTFLYKE